MSQTRIAVIVGSLRKDSFNRKLALAIAHLMPSDFTLEQLRIDDLPLYNQDDDGNQAPSVKRLKSEIAAAQGLIFVTPEYNRALPGVLKNAIDHASRPYGQSAWAGKPAGVIGISVGAIGTAIAQQQLRTVLAYLDVPTLGQPEAFIQNKEGLFDDQGHIAEGAARSSCRAGSTSTWTGSSATPLPEARRVRGQAARDATSWLAASPATTPMSARAAPSAAAFGASPMARPSARTKRTSVMPTKPSTTLR